MERLDSNQYQGMVEDQDNTSNAPKAKKSIRITTTDSNLERLVEITKSMSKEIRRDFDKMYGRILDLLDISVKTPVISALAQFWSSDLHCFELPNLDLVPTIEEYTRMTRLPIDDNVGVYSYRGRYVDERKIAKLIGFHPDQLNLKRGGNTGVEKIIPRRSSGGASWAWKDFGRIKVKRQEAREWKKELADIQDNKIAWTCPWYSPYEFIFSCGDFANVPLMGPRGCVAYTPSIALRQLKRTQVKPVEEQLGGIYFQYDVADTSQLLVRVRAAWRNVQRKGDDELGKPRVSASQEYNEWRKARGVPEYVLREAPHAEEALEKENAEILEGKLALEAENQTQGEHLKKLLAELADARNDTKNWWGLAKNYHEKNEELSQKVIKRKLKAKRKKQEADEAIEGWRLRTNVQRDKKKEWMKRCDDMADCVNYHSIELARRLGEAEDEIDRNPEIQLPPKTARFMRYCQDLARSFGREPKCLM
ncbi:hypothetical protein SESBI_07744 [Sesbania bispinosa]|nr:hypothetical protein SESBI_07744 [Sesbania bispinosa]